MVKDLTPRNIHLSIWKYYWPPTQQLIGSENVNKKPNLLSLYFMFLQKMYKMIISTFFISKHAYGQVSRSVK